MSYEKYLQKEDGNSFENESIEDDNILFDVSE